MPEGDSVRLTERRLAPVLVGRRILNAASRWPPVTDAVAGTCVRGLEVIGKHLLVHLDDGTTLRVHLGMQGRWHVLPPDATVAWSPGRVALRLDTELGVAVCTDAPRVQRFRTRERGEVAALDLGPDVLAASFDPAVAAARAAASDRTAAEVLLDQRVACGIGNVWKCELLFLHRLDPFAPADAVPAAVWEAVYRDAHARMTAAIAAPSDDPDRPSHVYRRRVCPRCGTRIRTDTSGRDLPRTTWWCPTCQPMTTR